MSAVPKLAELYAAVMRPGSLPTDEFSLVRPIEMPRLEELRETVRPPALGRRLALVPPDPRNVDTLPAPPELDFEEHVTTTHAIPPPPSEPVFETYDDWGAVVDRALDES